METETRQAENELFWEPESKTRWGEYLSEVEDRHIRFAHELCGHPSNAPEIGAEGGRWSKLLADLGWQMTCTDIVPEALQVCQQRIPDANCICVDVEREEIPADDHSQKLVLCIEVNEVLEPDWFIEEVDRVLEHSGVLVGVFQNRSSIRGTLKTWFPTPGDTFPHYRVRYRPWRTKMKNRNFAFVREDGLCWMPFGRRSNSPLIPLATSIERRAGLRRLAVVSPWIVFVAQRNRILNLDANPSKKVE